MKGSEIIERIGKGVDRINRLAAVVALTYDTEDIRRFRTEIKRLRAFLRLCRISGIGGLSLPASIERFYASVGAIRDLQLHLQRAETYFSGDIIRPEGYFGILRQELAFRMAQSAQLRSQLAGFSSQEGKGGEGKGGYEAPIRRIGHPEADLQEPDRRYHDDVDRVGLDKVTVKKYVKYLQKRLGKALGKEKEDDALHRLRKILKDIRYNQQVMESILKKPVPGLPDRMAVREMTRLLGVHQDLCVALQYARKTYTGYLERPEKGQVRLMRQWLRREKARIITQIIVKLEDPQFRPLCRRAAK